MGDSQYHIENTEQNSSYLSIVFNFFSSIPLLHIFTFINRICKLEVLDIKINFKNTKFL